MPEMKTSEEDEDLVRRSQEIVLQRRKLGLEGLVGGLQCVIINTEPDRLVPAAEEFLCRTGLEFYRAYTDDRALTLVLKKRGSPDFVLRARKTGDNPFARVNRAPKTGLLPNTRLETFVFRSKNLGKYASIQKKRGVRFMTPDLVRTDNHLFVQTMPSPYTGNSLGFIQWLGEEGDYMLGREVDIRLDKPGKAHLENIFELDHAAARVGANRRDAAVLEFLNLTNYHFDFAVHVRSLNSITSVARRMPGDFAMVFTSGIEEFKDMETSGPTEKFIRNYGPRVHHLAFRTENIRQTYQALADDGMEFLVDLVGSEQEGLRQCFSMPSEHTMLVNEYIRRYAGFDGFFTKSNVTELTRGTGRQ